MSTTFIDDIEAAVVTVFTADAELPGMAALIEAGYVDSLLNLELPGYDYVGVNVMAYGESANEEAMCNELDVDVNVGFACMNADQKACQQQVKNIAARLSTIVGNQAANRFGLSNSKGEITEVLPGRFDYVGVGVNKETKTGIIEAQYTFKLVYQLRLSPVVP